MGEAWVRAERQRQRLPCYEFNLVIAGSKGAFGRSRIASLSSIGGILSGRAAQCVIVYVVCCCCCCDSALCCVML